MKTMTSNNPVNCLKPAVVLAAALLVSSAASALGANGSPPERLSYQGYLVDANGFQLGSTNTGPKNYDVIFRIYNDQAMSSLANRLWAEQQTVTVDKGYFSVMLGEGSAYLGEPRPLLSTLFTNAADASDRFIEVTVKGIGPSGTDSTILPRMRLLSSPYSFMAKYALTANSMVNGAYGNVVTLSRTNVGINQAAPSSALDVAGTITGTGLNVSGAATIAGTANMGNVTASKLTVSNITVLGSISGGGTIPTGAIVMWSGSTAPTGWALCDGSTVNGIVTPDLRGRFVLGSGPGSGLTSRSLNAIGGEESHILTTNEIPAHAHAAADSGHTHGTTDPGHRHDMTDPSVGLYQGLSHDSNGSAVEYPTYHGGETGDKKTGISIDSGKAKITVGNAGGGDAHNIMPPYYVLAFIMRVN